MSRNSNIIDGEGSGKYIKVNDAGYILTQNSIVPPNDSRDLQIIYRKFLTLNADGTTTEMLVDGSTTPQKFYISAIPNKDIFITSLSIIIQGGGLSLGDNFAGGVALTNGVRMYYEDQNGEVNIGTDLTTNFSFTRLCQGNTPFGDNANAFIKTDGTPAIFPTLNFKKVFGFTSGLRLLRNTTNKLVLEVNDNLPGTVGASPAFTIIANGFELK